MQQGFHPPLLYVGLFALMGVIAYMFPLLDFGRALMQEGLWPTVTNRDYANYWVAGRMVVAGDQQELFTQHTYFEQMKEFFGADYPIHNWGYPPHFLLFVWPLGLIGYKAGLLAFLAVTLALFFAGVIVFRSAYAPKSDPRILVVALLPYVFMMVHATQNGFLTSAALLLGLAWMRRIPILAGMAFAALTIKPQLGFLILPLLLFDRNWSAIGWSAIFTASIVGLSVVLFGTESWSAYFTETLPYQRFVMTDWYGIFLTMMPTTYGGMRALGFSPGFASLVQWPISVGVGVLILWLLWKETDPLRQSFYVACGTFLVSPYAFNYDMGALSAVAAMTIGARQLTSRPAVIVVSVVAALPAVVMNLGRVGLPIAPAILGLGLLAVANNALRSRELHGASVQ